jgi:hypothetical protein
LPDEPDEASCANAVDVKLGAPIIAAAATMAVSEWDFMECVPA